MTDEDGTTVTHKYYSANWQVLEEVVDSEVANRYIWSPVYVDALMYRESDIDSETNVAGTRLWALTDANYNIVALVDNITREVLERYVYDPYGKVTVLDVSWAVQTGGSNYGWTRLFQGMEYDAAAGLYSQRMRWYS